MKEKFRDWRIHNTLKVSYIDGTGQRMTWKCNQKELLSHITEIVQSYTQQEIKLTNRQLYYQLVAAGLIPNADVIYTKINSILTSARYAGLIDWDALEDRGRVPEKPSEWDNIGELIKSACYSYRLPRWSDQENWVELYTEKQALESVFKPIADKWHIYFGCNKGYASASMIYEIGQRIKQKIQGGQKVQLLYLGDHDPSGLDMVRDIRERLNEILFTGNSLERMDEILSADDPFEGMDEILSMGNSHLNLNLNLNLNLDYKSLNILPLALNMDQINQYTPPPNPTKITDPRAEWYIKKFGQSSWELDALRPEILIKIVEQGIKKFVNLEKYNKWRKQEEREKRNLIKYGGMK